MWTEPSAVGGDGARGANGLNTPNEAACAAWQRWPQDGTKISSSRMSGQFRFYKEIGKSKRRKDSVRKRRDKLGDWVWTPLQWVTSKQWQVIGLAAVYGKERNFCRLGTAKVGTSSYFYQYRDGPDSVSCEKVQLFWRESKNGQHSP